MLFIRKYRLQPVISEGRSSSVHLGYCSGLLVPSRVHSAGGSGSALWARGIACRGHLGTSGRPSRQGPRRLTEGGAGPVPPSAKSETGTRSCPQGLRAVTPGTGPSPCWLGFIQRSVGELLPTRKRYPLDKTRRRVAPGVRSPGPAPVLGQLGSRWCQRTSQGARLGRSGVRVSSRPGS